MTITKQCMLWLCVLLMPVSTVSHNSKSDIGHSNAFSIHYAHIYIICTHLQSFEQGKLFQISTWQKYAMISNKSQCYPNSYIAVRLPRLKAWIGLSVQTWRSSTGPQAAIIRLAAADNCHQTKQDREILPLWAQLFSFSHPPLLTPLLLLWLWTDNMCSPKHHFEIISLGYNSVLTQNIFLKT